MAADVGRRRPAGRSRAVAGPAARRLAMRRSHARVTPRARGIPGTATAVPGACGLSSGEGCAVSSGISVLFMVIGLLATLLALGIVLRRSSGRAQVPVADATQVSADATA